MHTADNRRPYHLHVQIVLKCGTLTFPEPYGPIQACIWIALPFICYGVVGTGLFGLQGENDLQFLVVDKEC